MLNIPDATYYYRGLCGFKFYHPKIIWSCHQFPSYAGGSSEVQARQRVAAKGTFSKQ